MVLKIKKAREVAGINQRELLQALNDKGFSLTQAALSHYENGARNPDPELMIAIADITGVSLDFLCGRTKTSAPVFELEEALAAATGKGRINKIMDRLPRDKQQQVISFAEFLLSQEKKTARPDELNEWMAATEVLIKRFGQSGERSFAALLSSERPDLAAALGILSKQESVQNG